MSQNNYPPGQNLCIRIADTTTPLGAKLKSQVASYKSTYDRSSENTIASAFCIKDLNDIVSELNAYNASNPQQQVTVLRFVKCVVECSEINYTDPNNPSRTTIPTMVAVPTFEDGRSVFDILPSNNVGTGAGTLPAMYLSTKPCPKYC